MIPMIHTYRTPEISWPKNRLLRVAAKVLYYSWYAVAGAIAISFGALFVLFVLWLSVSVFHWPMGAVIGAGVVLALWALPDTRGVDEIRLNDDGTCEFTCGRQVVHAYVVQIASVEEKVDSDGPNYYSIRFRHRRRFTANSRRLTAAGLTDFEDFLTRIKTINPAIEIKRRKA
jgi:hypothetical protein